MALSRRERRPVPTKSDVPEGGWGWMVTIGMAVMFISTTGHYTAFGLLFENFLNKLDGKATGATIIMNSLTAAVNFTGLFTNYLLRTMSYRVVSVIGGLLFSVGIMLTVVADNMIQVVITYSIIAGVGLGLLAPSSYLAFNSYFSEKRAVAMGICQAAIGLGFMAAPPICQYLLVQYSFQGTMLILGGIALNSVVGAMLFRPVKSSPKKPQAKQESNDGMEDISLERSNPSTSFVACVPDEFLSMAVIPEEEDELTNDHSNNGIANKIKGLSQIATFSQDTECDEHIVISRRGSLVMSAMLDYRALRHTAYDEENQNGSVYNSTTGIIRDPDGRLNRRPISASLTNFSSTLLMFDNSIWQVAGDALQTETNASGCQRIPRKRPIIRRLDLETGQSLLNKSPDADDYSDESNQSDQTDQSNKSGLCRHVFQALSQFLDLSLFKDIVYMNIALGLSLSFVSDSNFFTIFPLFLVSKTFTGSDIALCISIASGADVVSRLILPWLSHLCHITPRTTYLLACLTSAIARSILVSLPGDFLSMAIMSGVIGFLKGGMVVNLSLTIGEHCNNEKFAGAYSLFMVMTGIITLSIGSFVGVLRDATDSYPFCIHVLSMGLILCAIMWLIEYALRWDLKRVSFTHLIKRAFCK